AEDDDGDLAQVRVGDQAQSAAGQRSGAARPPGRRRERGAFGPVSAGFRVFSIGAVYRHYARTSRLMQAWRLRTTGCVPGDVGWCPALERGAKRKSDAGHALEIFAQLGVLCGREEDPE